MKFHDRILVQYVWNPGLSAQYWKNREVNLKTITIPYMWKEKKRKKKKLIYIHKYIHNSRRKSARSYLSSATDIRLRFLWRTILTPRKIVVFGVLGIIASRWAESKVLELRNRFIVDGFMVNSEWCDLYFQHFLSKTILTVWKKKRV